MYVYYYHTGCSLIKDINNINSKKNMSYNTLQSIQKFLEVYKKTVNFEFSTKSLSSKFKIKSTTNGSCKRIENKIIPQTQLFLPYLNLIFINTVLLIQ